MSAAEGRVATAIRFSTDLHQQLATAAEERHLSINRLVVLAVEDFLPRLIPVAELSLTYPPKAKGDDW